MSILESADVPYGILGGNHDGGDGFANYHNTFGSARFQAEAYYHNDPSGNNDNHYDLISSNGASFVIVYLSYGTTASERAWASSVFQSYSDRIGILAIHDYIGTGGGYDGDGSALNSDVVLPNSNVWLVLCGHQTGAQLNVKTAGSRTYYELLSDYQALASGGNGYQKIFYFDVATNNVHVKTYSTVLDQFGGTGYGFDEFDMTLPYTGPYTVTFHVDPSGTITADGVPKSDGDTGSYGSGSNVHVIADAPGGYEFSSWETSGGVTVTGLESSVVLFLGMDGTDGSTSFPDSSASNHVMTANGGAQVDTAQSKFGGASGLFDGTGDYRDYLSTPDSADWAFGTSYFTIDLWFRFNALPATSAAAYLYSQYLDDNNYVDVYVWNNNDGTYALGLGTESGGVVGPAFSRDAALSTATWYHLALVRSGNNFYIFLNGNQVGSTYASSASMPDIDGGVTIASEQRWGYFDGWLDELRVSKGLARWTSNFTPPSVSQKPTAPYDTYMTVSGTGTLTAHFTPQTTLPVVLLDPISPQNYQRGDTVYYTGTVTIGGSPAPDGTDVGIVVKDSLGVEIFTDQKTTTLGAFSGSFIIGSSGSQGLWTLYASSGTGQDSETFYLGGWIAVGGVTPSRPAACWFNDHLYMIVRDNGGDPQGSGIWMSIMDINGQAGPWTNIGGLTPSAPACTTFNNRLYLFVRDANGGLWMRSMDTGGTWSAWTALEGNSPSSPAAAAFNGYLYLAVRGGPPYQDAIWLNRMDTSESWKGWTKLAGLTPDSPSLAEFNNHLYMVVEDVSGGIWMRSMDTTEAWSSWSPLGGLTSAPPSMAAYGGELYLFVRDISGGIWSNTMDTSGTWSGWVSPGGLTMSGPVGCATNAGVYIVVNDINGGLWVRKLL
jgi:hypothetical protein